MAFGPPRVSGLFGEAARSACESGEVCGRKTWGSGEIFNMTPEAQRIAIAEACGWKDVSQGVGPNTTLFLGDRPISGGYVADQRVPDYLRDRDAMAEAVEKQAEKAGYLWQAPYTRELRSVVIRSRRDLNEMQVDYWMAEASAAQRAEAFLRALWKWDDTK